MKAALARLSHYFWRTTADQCDEDLLALSGLPQLRGHLHPGHPHRPGRHHHRGHLHPGHLHRLGRDYLRGIFIQVIYIALDVTTFVDIIIWTMSMQ